MKFFFGKVREAPVERLGRKVELIIEKEKRSGDVLRSPLSSLSELAEADVLKGREKRRAREIIELLHDEISHGPPPAPHAEGELGRAPTNANPPRGEDNVQ